MNKRGMALIALMSMVPLDEAEELLSRNFSFEQEDTCDEGYPLHYESHHYRHASCVDLYPCWVGGTDDFLGLV